MSGETILVIDDGKENREFIVEYVLNPNNFRALEARDGREGLELARQYHPDLILLDLQMPIMNGMEVLDALNAERLEIPVILMTFHGSEEVAIEVYRKGVRDYVKKPYTVEEMYMAIDRSLTEVRLRKEKDQLTDRLLSANSALNQRVRELNVLYNVGKSVTTLMDIEALMGRIAEAAIQLTSSEEGSVYLVIDSQLQCKAIARAGEQTYTLNEAREEPLALQAIQSGQTVVLTEEQIALARRSNPSAPLAAMATPLVIMGQAVGALVLKNVSAGTRMFTRNDGALLSALSDYAAIAYQNASHHAIATKPDSPSSTTQAFRRALQTGVYEQLDPRAIANKEGARREISVMTINLQGHFGFVQKAPPEQIVTLLNEYLALAARILFAHSATIDHVHSDSMVALFNAPTAQPDHPHLAVQSALALREAIKALHEKRGGGLTFGIGLHVGEGVIGPVGIERSMSYSAVGEVVTIANTLGRSAGRGQILASSAFAERTEIFAEFQPVPDTITSIPSTSSGPFVVPMTVLELLALKAPQG
jgi:DNA-binding response OmpR family regulator/class 3 adenylate cyclase